MIEQDPPPEPKVAKPLPVVTIVLVAMNVAAYVLTISAGADPVSPSAERIFELGGSFGPITLDGESWRLVSSTFLHFGIVHIGMNMLGLVLGGRMVEPVFGRAGFAAIYTFAGLAGALVSALASKAVSAGASGAIFGVFGAWPAYLLFHHARFDKETLKKQSSSFVLFLGANLWIGLKVGSIDLGAHIGGLVAGFLAGLLITSGRQYRARVIAVFVCAGLVIASAHVIPPPETRLLLQSAKEKFDEFAKLETKALDRYNEIAKNDKLTEEEIANVIELEILPVWRDGKKLVWSAERLPKNLETNLRAYIETRERAWVTMVAALRKKDEAALAEAMKTMSEADIYIEKLKQ